MKFLASTLSCYVLYIHQYEVHVSALNKGELDEEVT